MIPSIRRMWKAALLTLLLDPDWYRSQYPDVDSARISPVWHFVRHGARERRSPSQGISTADVLRKLTGSTSSRSKRFSGRYRRAQQRQLTALLDGVPRAKKALVVYFNVASPLVSGGMLSINRFAGLTREHLSGRPDTAVLISTVPLEQASREYTLFRSTIEPIHFSVVADGTNPETVLLVLPEVYAVDFVHALNDSERRWLAGRVVEVIILNQNNSLMPHPSTLSDAMGQITTSVTIATAHESYTLQSLSDRFTYPVKRLTPLLPVLKKRPLAAKGKILMISPDRPAGDADGSLRDAFIDELGRRVPDLEIRTVEEMVLDDYLELASACVISVTLGEGLDGYFIEPVLAGGVSFALANPRFFPSSFDGCFAIALSLSDLIDRVVRAWSEYQIHPESYARDSSTLQGLISEIYSRERTTTDLEKLLGGQSDFSPQPQLVSAQPFENLRVLLAEKHGFKFVDSNQSTALTVSPDNEVIEHFGGEFYSVLFKIYFSQNYDSIVRSTGKPTVLFDIGANVGLASLYLSHRNPDIRAIYAYEPIVGVARVAQRNIARNIGIPVFLKTIALSDRFGVEHAELIDGWTTGFSVDDPTLNEQYKIEPSGRRNEVFSIEVEIVPASLEIKRVIRDNPDSRFVVKCDAQGSEFRIIEDLRRADLLQFIDLFVIESHFRSPDKIIFALETEGLRVTSRKDSDEQQVYLIVAERI